MSVKSWVLGRVHRIGGVAARGDLPERDTAPAFLQEHASSAAAPVEPVLSDHLGAYAALIGAVRDELEHFVTSHVRLHLAIADRDRFVLTSIGVHCRDKGPSRQLLKDFLHEFKPEQVKRYLAREVIGGLPNAAAIDLSQFAGLLDVGDAVGGPDDAYEYRELLDALRTAPAVPTRPYEVSVVGRWAELDPTRAAAPAAPPSTARAAAAPGAAPVTPMAGQRCEFDLEDADGKRRVVLPAVVPGRRYVVGKGEGCDIRVNATYASRRHAELWLDQGRWWVSDAGSTNGIRVESTDGTRGPSSVSVGDQAIALAEGKRIVLSARAEGPPEDYPCLSLRVPASVATRITPIAAAATGAVSAPRTPLTSVMVKRPAKAVLTLMTELGAGVQTLELTPDMLPASIGRSRNQSLVVERRYEGVSGYHLQITELDETGALVVVHGDNGVLIDGVRHGPGTRMHWTAGQALVLGASAQDGPTCRLALAGNGH
jgi:pSer/pThr/pTyr-binding forkhead associated (FHA) protein